MAHQQGGGVIRLTQPAVIEGTCVRRDGRLEDSNHTGHYCSRRLRKRPVCDALQAATFSGVPVTTTSPPA
jgi:hypothetical protein